jgi:hypothetical protein
MGHTTINKGWGIKFAPFGRISNNSQLQKQWFLADEDNAAGWGRSARVLFFLLLLVAAPYRLVHGFACNVQVIWRIRTSDLIFF